MIATILGIIGSIFGILGGVFGMMFGTFSEDRITMMGFSAIVASMCGLIGAILNSKKIKDGGWIMIIASIWGLVSISMFYILSFILLLTAGIIALHSKDNVEKKSKITIFALIVSIFFMFLIFSADSKNDTIDSPKKIEDNVGLIDEEVDENKQSDKEVIINVGDTAEIDNMLFKVVSVQRNYPGGQYDTLPSGKEWVLVSLYLENKGEEEESYNPYDFKIEDSLGDRQGIAFVSDIEDELNAGELAPGGKKYANLVFEVPKDDQNLKLIFEPDIFSEKKVIVRL